MQCIRKKDTGMKDLNRMSLICFQDVSSESRYDWLATYTDISERMISCLGFVFRSVEQAY